MFVDPALVDEEIISGSQSSSLSIKDDDPVSGASLLIIDSGIRNYNQLIDSSGNIEVLVLNDSASGIPQVTSFLSNYQDISSLHILSHGDLGQLRLGATKINYGSLHLYESEMSLWSNHLSVNADILLYGCNVASDPDGLAFVDQVSHITGADVAASADLTGHDSLGGDWILEYETGTIESIVPFHESILQRYNSLLVSSASVRIEAEDYLVGVNGGTYSDTTAENSGGTYRNDDVDIEETSDLDGGFNVGWIEAGEYLTFGETIEAGTYDIIARVAAKPNGTKSMKLTLGETETTFNFEGTGGWQNWRNLKIEGVTLNNDVNRVRVDMLTEGFNLNYIDLIPSTPIPNIAVTDNDLMIPPVIFPADAGISNVVDYGAIPNDGIDDTAAIQQALSETVSGNKIIYLPAGTYLVSDRLEWPAGESSSGAHKRTILQGENLMNTTIKLIDNAPGYQDPDNPKSVVWTGTAPANRFRNAVRDLTINVGENNPGAIGLQFIANNQGGIRNVNIVSEDGQGQVGLDMGYTREIGPAYVKNLYVNGFDYGIQTSTQVNSVTFEDISLENQNILGWENLAQSIFIRGLTSVNAVTALRNVKDSPGSVTLIDANLIGTGDAVNSPAILSHTCDMFLRNIETLGYVMAVKHDNKGRGNEPGVIDPTVDEWMACGDRPDSLFDSADSSLYLPIQNTPFVPWDNIADWASPLEFGGKPNDGIDDTVAIQAAIDSGAKTVYLPNGRWNIEGTLNVRGNVSRFLGTEAWLIGDHAEIRVLDTSQPVVQIERLDMLRGDTNIVHASGQTLVLSSVTMNGRYLTDSNLSTIGDLYIEDVVGGPFYFRNQNVWARQLNAETDTQKTEDPAKIINDNAKLWILGLKTERAGTNIQTINGGQTEVLGGLVYSTGDPKIDSAFINNESSLSLAGVVERNFNGNWFNTWVQETRDGETRRMSRGKNSVPLYVGY